MEEQGKRITFFSKNQTGCPVCESTFFREDLLSGGGRLIAGELTDELRRLYEPSKKYGELHPLAYAVMVCPSCLYGAYPQDFSETTGEAAAQLKADTERRVKSARLVFSDLDFAEPRDLREGAASYYVAVMSYDFMDPMTAPSFKQGLSALRCAWLMNTLHRKYPGENYDYLSLLFYRKARFFYLLALERAQTGEEPLEATLNYGPDLDKNYGYDGFLYIAGLLEYKYGPRQEPERRAAALENAKRIVSRLFGTGKASKSKPSAILDKARELYDRMNRELKELRGQE